MKAIQNFELELIEVKSKAKSYNPPLLFVHGACHGAWCWQKHYMSFFAEHGWDCLSLSLRGHGGSYGRDRLNQFGLDDYVADVLSVIEARAISPIVIGHSMGGGVAQLLMTRYPEKISGTALLASMPPGWVSFLEFLRFFRYPSGCMAMQNLMEGKKTTAKGILKSPFFSKRIGMRQATEYYSLLQPESERALQDMREIPIEGGLQSLPLLILGSKKDYLFGETAVKRTADHYKTKAIILNEGCHDLMLDPHWIQSAECILSWLKSSYADSYESCINETVNKP